MTPRRILEQPPMSRSAAGDASHHWLTRLCGARTATGGECGSGIAAGKHRISPVVEDLLVLRDVTTPGWNQVGQADPQRDVVTSPVAAAFNSASRFSCNRIVDLRGWVRCRRC